MRPMPGEEIRIYYLYHSGFAVKIKKHLLVFDYYCHIAQSGGEGLKNGVVSQEDLRDADMVYVFVSHSHGDHYNPVIFDWGKANSNIQYFLSSDIELPSRSLQLHSMAAYEEYGDGNIAVKTYGSTDLGVSFLVNIDGLKIFHAGDLNCWYWYYESTPQELEEDKDRFLKELDGMKDEDIDIAFFPVDPRLQEYYYMGGEYFIKDLNPDLFIPMHFGEDYGITQSFAKKVKELPARVATISHRGQEIVYKRL